MPVAAPERRPRRVDPLGRRDLRHLEHQRRPAGERPRLRRGPGAEPARQAARAIVGVRLRPLLARDRAARPDLPAQALPVHDEGRHARTPRSRAPSRSRSWCRRRRPPASISFKRTILTFGSPPSSTVASATALGSFGSVRSASPSHARASAKGSSPAKIPSGPPLPRRAPPPPWRRRPPPSASRGASPSASFAFQLS